MKYETLDFYPQDHAADVIASMSSGHMIPIVDDDVGIIGYALGEMSAGLIVAALNNFNILGDA